MLRTTPLACLALVFAVSTLSAAAGGKAAADKAAAGKKTDLLRVVRAYADCLLEHGTDTYGAQRSPLFAEALDRHTLRLLEGKALERAAAMRYEEWGIRSHDRMLTGGNPQHCENAYQVLYALSQATGERKYAEAADASLKWFFLHCQSPATGLFCWGEHSGWDFVTEKRITTRAGNTHEFYRPWVLWDRSWKLAPDACRKFAMGLWEHQIADHQSGDYSRHAGIDQHKPGRNAPYARHGGFYISTWAKAYEKTGDAAFLHAIEVVLGGLDNDRRHGGMVISNDRAKGARTMFDLSLAISLRESAPLVPQALAQKLRQFAAENEQAYLAQIGRLLEKASSKSKSGKQKAATNLWSSGYGGSGGEIAGWGNSLAVCYRLEKLDAYRKAVLAVAELYLQGDVNTSFPVYPMTVGKAILLMLDAYEFTGEAKYLNRGDELAGRAVRLFLADGCPLPKATHVHDHYEAVTGDDTLMMALLRLWAAEQKPPVRLSLTATDR